MLASYDTHKFMLMTEMTYKDATGATHTVPPSQDELTTTDLASVPPALWSILAPYGRQLRPALLHDHLCKVAGKEDNIEKRRQADNLFREALRDCDVPPFRSTVFWTGVTFGRHLAFKRPKGLGLLLLALLSAALMIIAATSWLIGTPDFLANLFEVGQDWPTATSALVAWAGAAAALPIAFGRDYVPALVAFIVVPVILPALVVNLATSTLLWLPDGLAYVALKIAGKNPKSPGGIGPTRAP